MPGRGTIEAEGEIVDPTEEVLELEEGSRSIIMNIIGQLRRDMDIQRITLPTFILEARSMLERVTDFMSHPDILIEASTKTDPLERFLEVVRYYLSGWHLKPRGVKKPYNPVLGEVFRCRFKYNDGTDAVYVSEQVSHHPPISAYYYGSPDHGVYMQGNLRPKTRFLGNSVATLMEGDNSITFTHLDNEKYDITMPNIYVRGILFGKMLLEMGDRCEVRCETSDLICEMDFKTKGFFSGQYNNVVGEIKRISTGEVLYEISGQWSSEMYIKTPEATNQTMFFDVKSSKVHPKIVRDIAKQDELESRRLWSKVSAAIVKNDQEAATKEKTFIENRQRFEAKQRKAAGKTFQPKFFDLVEGQYEFKGLPTANFENTEKAKAALERIAFSPISPSLVFPSGDDAEKAKAALEHIEFSPISHMEDNTIAIS